MQTPLANITPTPAPSLVPTATPTTTGTPPGSGGGAGIDPVLQDDPGPTLGIELGPSFEGVGNGYEGHNVTKEVPDANGDVGAYQYVQFTNTGFAIFDKKDGELIYGPAPGDTLFRDFGGPCETAPRGDPIVLYDQLAHRWILTILATTGGFFGGVQCIAVSESEDATGRYYRYEYDMGVALPDYPKFGLWPDAYYYTAFALGPELICAFDRGVMLQPNPTPGSLAQAQCCQTPDTPNKYKSILPADLDGAAAPTPGEPNYLLNLNQATRSLQLWTFHVDFTAPDESEFLGPYPVSGAATFEGMGCLSNDGGQPCVPQPETQLLQSLGERVMHRFSYRRVVDQPSLFVNHSVQVGVGEPDERIGVRWYEIGNPGAQSVVTQQGTFAPNESFRWMGSVAADRIGNIAAGYSVSSPTLHPSIAVTGRLKNDTPGIMRNELIVVTGAGSQGVPGENRRAWGDYTSMSIDPVYDCQFWYTNEYLMSNGVNNWKTHVSSFRFPDCIECVADCNLSGDVGINEVQKACNIALGTQPKTTCLQADSNVDRRVTVEEIIQGVGNYLGTCVQRPSPTPTPGQGAGGGGAGGPATPAELEIWPVSGEQGENVWFLVVLDSDADVSGIDFEVVYPADVLSPPVCTKVSNQVPNGHSVQSSDPEPGHQRVLLVDLGTYPGPAMANGAVLSCATQILGDAPVGTRAIDGEDQTLSDGYGNKIDSVFIGGTFTVYEEGGGPGGCSTRSTGSGSLPIEYALVLLPWLRSRVHRFRRRVKEFVLAAALASSLLGFSPGTSSAQQSFDAAGRWAATGEAASLQSAEDQRTWQIRDVQWADRRTITGRVAVVGVEFISVGYFEARIVDSRSLSGVIFDREGNQIGVFEAEVTSTGLSGRFLGNTGETGDLTWKAPDPRRLQALFSFAVEE